MPWLFLLLPWLELWTLIALGSDIGGLATLLYVAATLMLGMALIRRQGLSMLQKMQSEYGGRVIGPQLLLDEAALLGSGLLLMIPGLITDFLAVLLLFGPLRRAVARALRVGAGATSGPETAEFRRHSRGAGTRDPDGGSSQTLEGEFRRLDD